MKLRILFVAALWISTHVAAVPSGVAVGVLAGVVGARVAVLARARLRRLPVWPRPGEVELPAGPRRVLLLDTGLAGPR